MSTSLVARQLNDAEIATVDDLRHEARHASRPSQESDTSDRGAG